MYTGNTGTTTGAAAPTSVTTTTKRRYGLAVAWRDAEPEARRKYTRIDWDGMKPAEAFCCYRIGLQDATQADVAREANVSDAAVSQTLDRWWRRRLVSSENVDFTLPDPSFWAGLRSCFANREYCSWPAAIRPWLFSQRDWGQRRHESYAGIPADRRKAFRRFVAAEERGARLDVRSHWHTPPPADYYSTAAAAGLLFAPLASEATSPGGSGYHLTGERGESGFVYGPEDKPARAALDYADDHPAALSKPLDAPTLQRVRRMVKAGASTAMVAARLRVPEAKVRLVTGNPLPGVKSRA